MIKLESLVNWSKVILEQSETQSESQLQVLADLKEKTISIEKSNSNKILDQIFNQFKISQFSPPINTNQISLKD